MRAHRIAAFSLFALLVAGVLSAQSYAPPPVQMPDEETLKKIAAKTDELKAAVKQLRDGGYDESLAADVVIFLKAATWIVKHKEWYHKDYPQWTLDALETGLERARQLRQRQAPWITQTGRMVRGYLSALDGSVQPYGLVIPKTFGQDISKKWRLDVVLHGRDASLTEVKFIHQHAAAQAADSQEFIQLNIYGRGNNAYRWAGEVDVYEALTTFRTVTRSMLRREFVDDRRTVLRGFSMGGAGAWHLGLHNPSMWCSVSPGAGFTTTHGYVKDLPEKLPPYQEACLHIYDAADYAENAFNVPVVAYGGEKDPQLQAARNIEARLKPLNIPFHLIVGPNTEHRYHPESLKQIMALQAEHAEKGVPEYPAEVRFVSYTPNHHTCHWVRLFTQLKPYERSRIHAESLPHGFRVTTENVQCLALYQKPGAEKRESVLVEIDGAKVSVPLYGKDQDMHVAVLQKTAGAWQAGNPAMLRVDLFRSPIKRPNMCGPIDDAFTESFVCVRGTGKPWHGRTRAYAEANLKRFQEEWDKHFRGVLRVVNDNELTMHDLESYGLILFGDPGDNSVLRLILNRLPLAWTEKEIQLAGHTYDAASHVPVMIYPSPFAFDRYILINSGHTFHAKDFEGTNALLYPRLGDYAILKLKGDDKDPLGMEVATAGIFDVNWKITK
jgi:dienelactone hydrolase